VPAWAYRFKGFRRISEMANVQCQCFRHELRGSTIEPDRNDGNHLLFFWCFPDLQNRKKVRTVRTSNDFNGLVVRTFSFVTFVRTINLLILNDVRTVRTKNGFHRLSGVRQAIGAPAKPAGAQQVGFICPSRQLPRSRPFARWDATSPRW
jgi:hypothetical protein